MLRSAGTLASLLEAASLGQNGEPLAALQRQEFTLYWLLEWYSTGMILLENFRFITFLDATRTS